MVAFFLLLDLAMRSVLSAPLAVLGKLNLALDELFVLGTPVVDPFARLTCEFDESIL